MRRTNLFLTSTILVVLVSILLSGLDYYFVQLDGLPLREARLPSLGPFYADQLVGLLPVTVVVCFGTSISDLFRGVDRGLLRQEIALGIANLMLAMILEDGLWYAFRALAPLSVDPFGGRWIQPSDATAAALGYANIAGSIIPIWYFILIPPIVAILVGLMVLSPVES